MLLSRKVEGQLIEEEVFVGFVCFLNLSRRENWMCWALALLLGIFRWKAYVARCENGRLDRNFRGT